MSALKSFLMLWCVAATLVIVTADGRWTTALRREALTDSVVSEVSVEKESLNQDVHQNSAEVVASTVDPNHSAQSQTKDIFPVSFAIADHTLTEVVKPGGSSHSDSSNGESHNMDSLNIETTNAELPPLTEETSDGPSEESPAESVESQENVDPEGDSEEVFTPPGALASLK